MCPRYAHTLSLQAGEAQASPAFRFGRAGGAVLRRLPRVRSMRRIRPRVCAGYDCGRVRLPPQGAPRRKHLPALHLTPCTHKYRPGDFVTRAISSQESPRGPQPFRASIVSGGVYAGHAAIYSEGSLPPGEEIASLQFPRPEMRSISAETGGGSGGGGACSPATGLSICD